ncbi:PREDICTED: zinc finger AN1 domain-containing stress-associated protein 12 [Tarenaya hassleriana]|uniref:zinc finger AN1 domain-containing stress-associated protein 12 n=1 Tax=Tarenaya hassleriana TaxID=28532 RepID=UPI00053C5C68|nr:PREDICTED: zinc finger AN1 domain-containing stress-associated protein 12 [Tarenaya hassleriana]
MSGGTEAFPGLGKHCQNPDCKQLDFLPFTCDGCKLVFCLEHRSYKSHDCPKSDQGSRTVLVCEACSAAIETTGCDENSVKSLLEKHERSGDCDPTKKKKPTCPVRRCREVLTFMNNVTCKDCGLKVCLKHRFPADHACTKKAASMAKTMVTPRGGRWNEKFLEAFASRDGKACGRESPVSKSPMANPSVRSF